MNVTQSIEPARCRMYVPEQDLDAEAALLSHLLLSGDMVRDLDAVAGLVP